MNKEEEKEGSEGSNWASCDLLVFRPVVGVCQSVSLPTLAVECCV